MSRDAIREGSYRLGALVQIYVGPKMLQMLERSLHPLPETDVRMSNEARAILEKALPTMKLDAWLPPVTAAPDNIDAAEKGPLKRIMTLVPTTGARLRDLQGTGAAVHVYHFTWCAVFGMQLHKYVPHRGQEIQVNRQALSGSGGMAGLPENRIQEFIADPRGRWGPTFDLILEEKKSLLGGLFGAKEPRFEIAGEASDDLITRWLKAR